MKTIYYTGGFQTATDLLCKQTGMKPASMRWPPRPWNDISAFTERLQTVEGSPFIILDFEGPEFNPCINDVLSNLNPDGVANCLKYAEAAKAARPDVQVAFCGPNVAPWRLVDYAPTNAATVNAYMDSCKPIVKSTGIICPSFYVNSPDKIADMRSLMRKTIAACRRHFPKARIRPFIWPHYWDLSHAIHRQAIADGYDCGYWNDRFVWTQEQIASVRMKPSFWSSMLATLRGLGINEIVLWLDMISIPFDPTASWWRALKAN